MALAQTSGKIYKRTTKDTVIRRRTDANGTKVDVPLVALPNWATKQTTDLQLLLSIAKARILQVLLSLEGPNCDAIKAGYMLGTLVGALAKLMQIEQLDQLRDQLPNMDNSQKIDYAKNLLAQIEKQALKVN